MKFSSLLFLGLFLFSCADTSDSFTGHQLKQNGDHLLIRYAGEAEVVQFKMFEGLQLNLDKKENGLFEGKLEIPDLENGIFSYDIIVHRKDSLGNLVNLNYKPTDPDQSHFLWIGANRTADFDKADTLKGKISELDFSSTYLGQERKLTIYEPESIDANTSVFYLTDGAVVAFYGPYIDELISQKKIRPIILIGIHSSRTHRYEEYVNVSHDNTHFKNHERFFLEGVIPEMNKKLNLASNDKYLYGFSNGAAFCMNMGINHPDLFKEIIAYSTADYISEFSRPIDFKYPHYPYFRMGAGRYEESIFKNNMRFVNKMKENKVRVEFKEFISGHDYNVWRIEFLEYLEEHFSL